MKSNVNNISDQNNYQERSVKEVSNSRNVLAQCFALGPVCLLKFTLGSLLGMTTVLLSIISDDKAEEGIRMSKSEYTWFSSHLFMSPFGSIIAGPTAHVFGSRVTLMIASIGTSGSWITFHLAKNATAMMVAQAVAGLSKGFILGPGFSYIGEVSQPHLRGTLMAISSFNVIIGSFLAVLISKFLPWRTIALINFALSVSGFVSLLCVPDGPYWLVVQGKFTETKRSLAWLRGWTTLESVETEFNHISQAHHENQRTSCNANSSWKPNLKALCQRSFLTPLAIVLFIYIVGVIAGGKVLDSYSIIIFKQIKAPMDEHTAAIVFQGMRVTGSIFYILSAHHIGNKNLCLLSLSVACFCYTVVAVVTFMLNKNFVTGHIYLWISPVMIIISAFVTSAGLNKVCDIINGEIFPVKYRNIGSAIGSLWFLTAVAGIEKIFAYMIDLMTLSGVFSFFAIVGLFGLIIINLVLPETNGRSLIEIENHFTGVKNMNYKSTNT